MVGEDEAGPAMIIEKVWPWEGGRNQESVVS